jgi:predicted glycoside hydrolase/deacetylase ChbG (UPF0249 family)
MILCADDYGLSTDVDQAILELAGSRRLTAVSCMVLLEKCTPKLLADLCAHESKLDIGLHLCLTDEGLPLSAAEDNPLKSKPLPVFGALLKRALRGALPASEVALQVSTQYALFVKKCGRKPDYIDGHLHVHQLPGARQGLLDFVHSLPAQARPYIRNTEMPLSQLMRRRLPWLKSALIGFFGSRMSRQLRAASIPTNSGFAGIYDFRRWNKYPVYFPRFIACLSGSNGLLVVHPGHQEEWRQQEFSTIKQFDFPPGLLTRFRYSS